VSTASGRPRHNWRRVTGSHPCPVCGKPDWCSLSADGTLAVCRRVEVGCWKSKTDKSGTPVYLHRLDGAAPAPSVPPPAPSAGQAVQRAGPDTLHRAYSGLLARLQLAQRHRAALRGRGLSDEQIDRRQYCTLPARGRARLARDLREQLGDALLSVPGFVVKPGAGGRPYVSLAGASGLLVPVRGVAGLVVALLVRRDDAGDGRGKYLYLSSVGAGGPGPGSPAHVPLGTGAPVETVRLVEGILKADVAAALSGLPSVGAAGLAWRPAVPVLRALGTRAVRLAYDADARCNPHVARALISTAAGLTGAGLAVELERWPAPHKGIDDALAGGAAIEVLVAGAARQAIAETAAAAGVLPRRPALGGGRRGTLMFSLAWRVGT
jgi:hypothetical protein